MLLYFPCVVCIEQLCIMFRAIFIISICVRNFYYITIAYIVFDLSRKIERCVQSANFAAFKSANFAEKMPLRMSLRYRGLED
jgi:hypothetical protein